MEAADLVSLPSLNVDGLKELCRKYGLHVTGKKDELLARLRELGGAGAAPATPVKEKQEAKKEHDATPSKEHEPTTPANTLAAAATHKSPQKERTPPPDYASMTLDQLKAQCKAAVLPSTGKKDELVARLQKRDAQAEWSKFGGLAELAAPQLKVLALELGLDGRGTKAELFGRLKEHLLVLVTALSEEALREALQARGLDTGGSKADLAARLQQKLLEVDHQVRTVDFVPCSGVLPSLRTAVSDIRLWCARLRVFCHELLSLEAKLRRC
jgi:hypothetical protein